MTGKGVADVTILVNELHVSGRGPGPNMVWLFIQNGPCFMCQLMDSVVMTSVGSPNHFGASLLCHVGKDILKYYCLASW